MLEEKEQSLADVDLSVKYEFHISVEKNRDEAEVSRVKKECKKGNIFTSGPKKFCQ